MPDIGPTLEYGNGPLFGDGNESGNTGASLLDVLKSIYSVLHEPC